MRIRRLVPDQPEPRHSSTFLVDGDDRLDLAQIAEVIDQLPQLHRALNVAAEKNEAAGLNPAKQRRAFRIQFVARNTGKDQLAKRSVFHGGHFTFGVELRNNISLKKIGIFGGTFDPIHHGHLILARDAVEQLQLDELVFIPAAISPHKLGQSPAVGDARVEMLRAAIEGEPQFCLDTLELERPAPSYAVDTIEALRTRDRDRQFVYLIGEDNVARLSTWHRFPELSQMVQFAVLDRTGLKTQHPFPTVRRHVDISATDIRNRVARGRSIRYLVPPAVEEIIRQRQLYRES